MASVMRMHRMAGPWEWKKTQSACDAREGPSVSQSACHAKPPSLEAARRSSLRARFSGLTKHPLPQPPALLDGDTAPELPEIAAGQGNLAPVTVVHPGGGGPGGPGRPAEPSTGASGDGSASPGLPAEEALPRASVVMSAHWPAGGEQGVPAEAKPRRAAAHTLPIEQGGLTTEDLRREMAADARVQDEIIPTLSEILEETVQRNDARKGYGLSESLRVFEGNRLSVSVPAYLKRIIKYGGCSTCCIAVGLLYLERLKKRYCRLALTSCNIQRLFLVATMTAAKFLDDFYYNNAHWAEIAGLSLQEINALELDFLFLSDFNLGVSTEEYKSFIRKILDIGEEFEALRAPKASSPPMQMRASRVRSSSQSSRPSSKSSSRDGIPLAPDADAPSDAARGAVQRRKSSMLSSMAKSLSFDTLSSSTTPLAATTPTPGDALHRHPGLVQWGWRSFKSLSGPQKNLLPPIARAGPPVSPGMRRSSSFL